MRRAALAAGLAAVGTLTMAPGAQAAQRYVADEVIVKYKSGITESQRSGLLERAGVERTLGSVQGPERPRAAHLRQRGHRGQAPERQLERALRRAELHPAHLGHPERPALRRAVRPEQHRPERRHRRRRHRRPRGLGRGRPGLLPRQRRREGRASSTPASTRPTRTCRARPSNCARSGGGLVPIGGGSIQEGSCADDNDHGTHVAGTIAATANNGKGVAGVAFNSQLAICKALGGPLGSGSTSDVANCINWTASQGRQGHLDEPGRRQLDHAAAGGPERRRHGDRDRRRRQRRRRHAELPGRLPGGRVGRGHRQPRRAGQLLERQRGRGDRGAGRGHAVDQARRRLRDAQRHVDGHPARGRRGRGDRPAQPGLHARRRSAASWTRRSTTRAPRAATRASASAA